MNNNSADVAAVQLDGTGCGYIIGCSLLFGDREVCAASWKGEGLLCTDITHSKKGMHKLMKSATLHGYGCYGRDTENLHQ